MIIIKPYIFKRFPEIIFGFSTRIGMNRKAPFYFNLSYNTGDEQNIVDENRKLFFEELGLSENNIAFQKQVHGNEISFVNKNGNCGESDALSTNKKGLGLAITSADCTGIFIYDFKLKIIAAIHSGWRGTAKKIVQKTLLRLKDEFNCKPENLICYLSPSISQQNYEVSKETADQFDSRYYLVQNSKIFLDIKQPSYDMLINFGVKKSNIQLSNLCSFEYNSFLHSYRRDGKNSGRSIGVIAMKENC